MAQSIESVEGRNSERGAVRARFSSIRLGALAAFLVVSFLLASACVPGSAAHRMASIDNLAVIVRVHEKATIDLAKAMPVDSEGAERLEALLAERLGRVFPPYAFEESLRQAWVDALARPLRFEVIPSLEVASALGSLLAKEENPRYDRLRSIGADAVLEINVTDWGLLANSDHLGGFLRMNARLIRLDRRERVVWRTRERLNRVREGVMPAEQSPVLLESDAALQLILSDLLTAAGTRLARSMRVAGDA